MSRAWKVEALDRQRLIARALEMCLRFDDSLTLWKRRKLQSMLRLLRAAITENEKRAKSDRANEASTADGPIAP